MTGITGCMIFIEPQYIADRNLESCSFGACKTFPLGTTSRLDLQSVYGTTSIIESRRWVIRCVTSSHLGRESGNQRMALTVSIHRTHDILLHFSLLVLCLAALGRGRGTGSRRPAARGVRHSGQEHRNGNVDTLTIPRHASNHRISPPRQ